MNASVASNSTPDFYTVAVPNAFNHFFIEERGELIDIHGEIVEFVQPSAPAEGGNGEGEGDGE